jgi:hypothetical protein
MLSAFTTQPSAASRSTWRPFGPLERMAGLGVAILQAGEPGGRLEEGARVPGAARPTGRRLEAPGSDLHSWCHLYLRARGMRSRGYFAVLHGTPRSRQIFRARTSRISVCRGTDDRRFRGGFAHQEWLAPSRICPQPCFRRCLSRSARFIPRRALRCSRALQLAQRPDD